MPTAALPFGSKRDVARLLDTSTRMVETLMAEGMPYLRLGTRRVRFDMAEVAAWVRSECRVQHRSITRKPEAAA